MTSDRLTTSHFDAKVSFEDVVDFFSAAKVDRSCAACGFEKWSIMREATIKEEDAVLQPTIPFGNKQQGYWEGYSLPVVICSCKRCGHMRFHSRWSIAAWVAAGKKEIGDNGIELPV